MTAAFSKQAMLEPMFVPVPFFVSEAFCDTGLVDRWHPMTIPMPHSLLTDPFKISSGSAASTTASIASSDEFVSPSHFKSSMDCKEVIAFGAAKAQRPTRAARRAGESADGDSSRLSRWWTKTESTMLCPVTNFPIHLLPYPPFKVRVDPQRSSPCRLVDGKSLAMQVIVSGRSSVCFRELDSSDLEILDQYVHRCKLGPFRPSRALELAKQAASGEPKAAAELKRLRAAARLELGKLRHIQENRLQRVKGNV